MEEQRLQLQGRIRLRWLHIRATGILGLFGALEGAKKAFVSSLQDISEEINAPQDKRDEIRERARCVFQVP